MFLVGLPFAVLVLAPGHGHTAHHGRIKGHAYAHSTPVMPTSKSIVIRHTVPLTSALDMGSHQVLTTHMTPEAHRTTTVAMPVFTIRHKLPASGNYPWNYKGELKAEAVKTAKSVPGVVESLSSGQIAELKKAFANGNLTLIEAESLQSDLVTIRTRPKGSSAVREAISRITGRLQYAGISSNTLSTVQDSLKKAAGTEGH